MTLDELFAQPSIARQRERLLELLRALSFQERDVVLASGLRSNFYIDCRRVSLDAEGHFLIGQSIFEGLGNAVARMKGLIAAAREG